MIIIFAVDLRTSMLSQWKKILVSSANILTLPKGQQFDKSLINRIKNKGPSTET